MPTPTQTDGSTIIEAEALLQMLRRLGKTPDAAIAHLVLAVAVFGVAQTPPDKRETFRIAVQATLETMMRYVEDYRVKERGPGH